VTGERVQRRLAAVLAADVAGYSRLMGVDEVGTLEALKAHRREVVDPAIADHNGRIVKTTGDGMLVEFSSAVDAVTCAMLVQDAMAERNKNSIPVITFRIGINVGDIIFDGDDIFGDGVNVAARVENECEPGGVCLSGNAFEQVRGKTGFAFADLGERSLKNIDRPVRLYAARSAASSPASSAKPPAEAARLLALPDKPSIAVLPFDNMGEASDDVYFGDGIAEDIITELSRYPDLFVVARNSSFIYRGKAVRHTDVARDLGVRYILEGSVRRAGGQIRVNAQLIDAVSGKHLWAQRYDRHLQDLFAVQDELTRSIVSILPERVQAAALNQASRKTSSSLDSYDHLLQGKYYHHLETPDANREADAHFDQAIALDPRFASAYAWKACTIGQAIGAEYKPRTPEAIQQSVQLIEQAMSIDANDTECHRIMCRIALMQGQFSKSEHHLEFALMLNPGDPRLVVQRGINLTFLGDPEAAIPWIEQAMRLDPFSAHRYYLDMVRALFMAGRPAEAVAVLERNARSHWMHDLWLAACHATVGNLSAGREAGQRVMTLRPGFTIASYLDSGSKWKKPEDRARLCDALTRAGLPND
jgi:adenylate cyclase